MRERVVVTGIGVVAPNGVGAEAFLEGLREGRSGVGPIRAFDCAGFDTRIAAEVDAEALELDRYVKPLKMVKLMSRAARFAVVAAGMARRHSKLAFDAVDPGRVAVSLGAGGMGPSDNDMMENEATALLASHESRAAGLDVPAFAKAFAARTNPISLLRGLPNVAASHVAIQQRARGPNNTITTACTAGTQAIGEGARKVQCGDADVVLAGGADAMVNPVGVLGFSMLGTLSERNDCPEQAARPFDRTRDGFVIGEGAAVLVLERESFAQARGADILGEIAGYGATCDAYRITDERPDASGAVAAIRAALRDADADAADVDYVNAHGTGTRMNDQIEARALTQVLGPGAGAVPVSSTKSMIGHLLAAAGAAEAVACLLAINHGFVPPTINYREPDPDCALDPVPNKSREVDVTLVLSNSFGFGGQNACLAIRRY